jgi:aspartyl/asparaginyl-tRNA synthetase
MQRIKIKDLLKEQKITEGIIIKGWVRSCRGSKNVSFIALNDGSTINNIQIVAEAIHFELQQGLVLKLSVMWWKVKAVDKKLRLEQRKLPF